MAVLSNNGRLISSLPIASSITGTDELLIQSNGVTKRIMYTTISSSLFSSLSSYAGLVKFTDNNNQFTGSFYNPDFKSSNFYTVRVRDNITVDGKITGDLTGSVYDTNFSKFTKVYVQQQFTASKANLLQVKIDGGSITGTTIGLTSPSTIAGSTITATTGFSGNITSTGTSTFSSIDVNGGSIDGTIIGASSAAAVTGTTITANTGFVGNLTGDVYNSTATKVLESGNTTPTINGGVSSAFFYGTSSYATQALTAAYAAGGVGNGLPAGGSTYQILAKTSNSDYQVTWTNPITASSSNGVGTDGYITLWGGGRTLKNLNNFYYDGTDRYVVDTILQGNKGMYLAYGAFTGSYRGNATDTKTIGSLNQGRFLNGVKFSTIELELSQSGNVTMSLLDGQSSTVLVKNSGAYIVQHWSGSVNGSQTANTKIYWKSGVEPTVTSGDLKQDVFTFVNIKNRIYGSSIQNFS